MMTKNDEANHNTKRDHLVYLGIGSNVGNREENLGKALTALHQSGVQLSDISSVYESSPVDLPDQPDFLNIATRAITDLDPYELLKMTKQIEQNLGREKTTPKGPRVIDIDILLYDTLTIKKPDLIIPHPRLLRRSFVMVPLIEVDPEIALPSGEMIRHKMDELPDDMSALKKVGSLVLEWPK